MAMWIFAMLGAFVGGLMVFGVLEVLMVWSAPQGFKWSFFWLALILGRIFWGVARIEGKLVENPVAKKKAAKKN